jgi:hypothetical protein
MYITLLFIHSILRWLVLASLLYAIFRSAKGYYTRAVFGKSDDRIRHRTATLAHIQLLIGIMLYAQSPWVKAFFSGGPKISENMEAFFFAWIHIGLMTVAIVLITIGSGMAKNKTHDRDKFGTMLLWFSLALLLIFLVIPWPFSPLANRPYLRLL